MKDVSIPRRVAAILLTFGIAFHLFTSPIWHSCKPLLQPMHPSVSYPIVVLAIGLALTLWAPRRFGLVPANTRKNRRVISTIGGVMAVVACTTMLFMSTPFYGGTMAYYLIVPLAEEVLFRGFLFAVIDDAFPRRVRIGRYDVALAVFITAIAFGLWHLSGLRWPTSGFTWFQLFYTTIAGLGMGIIRQATGSIWGSWGVHFIVNLWSVHVPGFLAPA